MTRGKLVSLHALLTVDNAQSHVTAFRPISEAARSWSDDNTTCINVRNTSVSESQHYEMLAQVLTVRLVQTQNHGNLRPADGAPARLLFQLGDARRTEALMPTRHKRKSCITLRDETHFAHILRRRCTDRTYWLKLIAAVDILVVVVVTVRGIGSGCRNCVRTNTVTYSAQELHACIGAAGQWTDICNTRCSILSRFSHFQV